MSDLFDAPARNRFIVVALLPKASRNAYGKVAASNGCSASSDIACSISTAFNYSSPLAYPSHSKAIRMAALRASTRALTPDSSASTSWITTLISVLSIPRNTPKYPSCRPERLPNRNQFSPTPLLTRFCRRRYILGSDQCIAFIPEARMFLCLAAHFQQLVRGLLDAPAALRRYHAPEEIRHAAIWSGAVF